MVAIIVPDQTHGNNCQSRVPIYLELMRLSRAAICRNEVAGSPSSVNVRISDSTITLNGKGVSAFARDMLHSYKNNRISGNTNDDTSLVTPLSLQ